MSNVGVIGIIVVLFAFEFFVLYRMNLYCKHGEIEKLFFPYRHENPASYLIKFRDRRGSWFAVLVQEIFLLNDKQVVVQSRPFCEDHGDLQIREVILFRQPPDGKMVPVSRFARTLSIPVAGDNDIIFEIDFFLRPKVKLLKIAVTNDYSVNNTIYVGNTVSWQMYM